MSKLAGSWGRPIFARSWLGHASTSAGRHRLHHAELQAPVLPAGLSTRYKWSTFHLFWNCYSKVVSKWSKTMKIAKQSGKIKETKQQCKHKLVNKKWKPGQNWFSRSTSKHTFGREWVFSKYLEIKWVQNGCSKRKWWWQFRHWAMERLLWNLWTGCYHDEVPAVSVLACLAVPVMIVILCNCCFDVPCLMFPFSKLVCSFVVFSSFFLHVSNLGPFCCFLQSHFV